MTTIPGKFFELIQMEKPVLAIINKSSELSSILLDTNKGRALCDKDEIYNFITKDYVNYKGYSPKVELYSRKEQAKKLCCYLNDILR